MDEDDESIGNLEQAALDNYNNAEQILLAINRMQGKHDEESEGKE